MIYKQKLQNNETHLTYIMSIRYVYTTFNQLEALLDVTYHTDVTGVLPVT